MVLVHKRLEGGKFVWPQVRDGVMRMPWRYAPDVKPRRIGLRRRAYDQAARRRENRAHAIALFTFKQQNTGSSKMQRELSNLRHENPRLQRELKATETRGELITKENRRPCRYECGVAPVL
ncbi:MAG: hypothetical protein MEQ74_08815 [Paracoccus sp.]|nr:hypothetical protein [Paracoccus sp. (in: a-proteobacteria)]